MMGIVDLFRGMQLGIRVGVWWNVALLVASVAAMPFDGRRILGLNPWVKPVKFEISVIVFLLTMGLLLEVLGVAGRSGRTLGLLGWGFGIAMIVENSIIAMQSARGVRSHMNYTTAFDGAAFGTMGVFILFNTVILAWMTVLFFDGRLGRPLAELWGIRLGLGMMLAASLEGLRIVMNGGHTVGADDGGSGLAFVNWSTQHGDLRVAHFFGLHAVQLLWFAGWLMARAGLSDRIAGTAMLVLGAVYAGLVWVLFAGAMAGRPLLAGR